jgi:hypothetical protein
MLGPLAAAALAIAGIVAPAFAAAAALAAAGAQGGAQAAGALAAAVSVAHTGGIVGQTPLTRRVVNPAIFAGAIKYHTGSNGPVGGLRPGEVPAILQKGEHVLTARQAAQQSSKATGGDVAIRNVLVTDPNFVPDAMATAQGEKVLMTILQRNKATVRQIVG